MGIFADRGTPEGERRTLFWLVCITTRLLVATAFTAFSLYWDKSFPYIVGGIGIVGGLGFWIRAEKEKRMKKVDTEKEEDWWFRSVHGFIWLGGGLSAILVRHFVGVNEAAGAIAAFFYGDVLFGIGTACLVDTSWIKKEQRDRLISPEKPPTSENNNPRFISIKGDIRCYLSGCNTKEIKIDEKACFTCWSFVHMFFASILGLFSYGFHEWLKIPIWIPSLFFSFLIVGWEAFENTNLKLKKWLFKVKDIDSDANLLGDLIIGFSFLWGAGYIIESIANSI